MFENSELDVRNCEWCEQEIPVNVTVPGFGIVVNETGRHTLSAPGKFIGGIDRKSRLPPAWRNGARFVMRLKH